MNTSKYQFNHKQIFSLIFITLFGVICSVSFHIPLLFGFLPGFIYLVLLLKLKGATSLQIREVSLKGIRKTQTVVIILLLVSFVLPSWALSGTIDRLVTISLLILSPEHFFLFTFIIAMLFSMMLGTTVGTLSAVGIPIMSTALSIHVQPEIVAGALISGAFVGDRTSPFSSAFQLLANTVNISTDKQFKAMLPTTVLALLLCIGFYGMLDIIYEVKYLHSISYQPMEYSYLPFLPPILLITLVLLRKGIITAFISSILSAIILSFFNGISLLEIIKSLIFGIEGLGGGLINMYSLLLFLVVAGAYNGLLEEYQIFQPFIDKWLKNSNELFDNSCKTMIATLAMSLIAANQTLPIILTGQTLSTHWKTKHSNEEFVRVMGDSTMLFPGMIPWSVLALMCSTIIGVPILSYLPYSIFLWGLPVITLIVSGYKQIRRKRRFVKAGTTL